ncbi:MAG: caspase family protein, partial [Blautia sp.]|nr:caspase family protein [Blautia sp.]
MKVKTLVISLLFLVLLPCLHTAPQAATLSTPKLTKVSNYAGGVKVKWKQVKGATGYYVYRKIPGSIFRKIATIKKADRLYYKDPSVVSDVAYVYTVMAYKSGKKKVKSAYDESGLPIVYCEEPALKAQLDSTLGIRLFWEKCYCQGYILYRREEGGSFQKIVKIEGSNIINYLDTTAQEGKTYYYSIRSFSSYEGKNYYSTYNQEGWKASHAESKPPEKSESIVYRALLVGESKYDNIFDPRKTQNLRGPSNDVKYMKKLLSEMNYSLVNVIENVGKMQVLSSIASTFDGADENDVSLFFYSGHGSTDRGSESGSLVLRKGSYEYLTMEELALSLVAIPGKVIVILDSCGSGAALNAMPGGTTEPSESEEDEFLPVLDPFDFNELIKRTFQKYDTP